jgi:uncharacterized protein (TIGR04255 family)
VNPVKGQYSIVQYYPDLEGWKTINFGVVLLVGERAIFQTRIRTEDTPTTDWTRVKADSFFHQNTIPLKGYPYEVRLIRAVQPAAEKSGSRKVLIVDIDVSTTRAVTFDQLDRALDEMRYIKNKVFFTYMKDAAERFK